MYLKLYFQLPLRQHLVKKQHSFVKCNKQVSSLLAKCQTKNKAHTLGSFCPNMLFPYARETISNLVNRGTFPPLNLAPVNFDAIFAAYVQKTCTASAGRSAKNGRLIR